MRLSLFPVVAAALALGVMGACAESKNELPPTEDGGSNVVPDSGGVDPPDAAPDDASDAGPTTCSRAGWCLTTLPDGDLVLKDIWPLTGRAFAIGTSPTVGVKVLEWVESDRKWSYIDDGTQNESGLGRYLGRIWAPTENEVYYGLSPGLIYHGVRSTSAQGTWSWTRSELPDYSRIPGRPNAGYFHHPFWGNGTLAVSEYALGVWGTGPNDVYAWYLNAIFHWKSEDGGPASWVLEHVARDVPETDQDLYFVSAAGTSANDIWFGGARPGSNRACALVVNKVAGEYRRAADGILMPSADAWDAVCVSPEGVPSIDGATGWAADIQSPAPGVAVTLKGGQDLARLTRNGDGYSVSLSHVPGTGYTERMLSLWAPSEAEQWISGKGLIYRANEVWKDGSYEISTLEMRGAPVRKDLHRIRGTSASNLWAIGDGYALHKTQP